MKPLTEQEILRFDLRNSAYHEVAHAVLSARFTHSAASCGVWLNPDPNHLEKFYLGQAQSIAIKVERDRAATALAGEIAHAVSRNGSEFDQFEIFDHVHEVFEHIIISDSDREKAGPNWEDHLDYAIDTCRECWSEIERYAEKLIASVNDADGAVGSVVVEPDELLRRENVT